MRRTRHLAALGSLVAAAGLLLAHGADGDGTGSSGAARLLGPFAHIASDALWVAARAAQLDGEPTRAVVLAERAVALTPSDSLGWQRYGGLLGSELGSPTVEPDPAIRLAWVEAALAVYARGEAVADEPGELALARAVLLLARHEVDPELPWPEGPLEPLVRAARALDEAAIHLPFLAEDAAATRARLREQQQDEPGRDTPQRTDEDGR